MKGAGADHHGVQNALVSTVNFGVLICVALLFLVCITLEKIRNATLQLTELKV